MKLIRKIQYSQYWNIGFCEQTPDNLLQEKSLKHVKWLKHPYRDRWFADPFLFRVTEDEIVVFVEECPIENPKGRISELVIDRKTMHLKKKYVLLELDTHLSYPAILWHEGRVYVYPENGASGQLCIYEYDELNHRLGNPLCILKEAVADATIVKRGGQWYMSATKFPQTQEEAFLYVSDSPFEEFKQMSNKPYQISKQISRQGGNFFEANGGLYRPTQDCEIRYGGAINILASNVINEEIVESVAIHVAPQGNRYCLGLHTINFLDGCCVIDGCGYYFPVLGKLYYHSRLRSLLKR